MRLFRERDSIESTPESTSESTPKSISESTSESQQAPQNIDTCGNGEKVCGEFAESLGTPSPITLIALENIGPSTPLTPQTETVRRADLGGMEGKLVQMLSATTGKISNRAGLQKVLTLAAKYREEESIAAVAWWIKHRDLTSAKCPFVLLADDFEDAFAQMQQVRRRAEARITNKKRGKNHEIEMEAWRERLNAVAEQPDLEGCPRGTPDWETKLREWVTSNPAPPWVHVGEDGEVYRINSSDTPLDNAIFIGQRCFEAEQVKLAEGQLF